jgi:hypothetical protein
MSRSTVIHDAIISRFSSRISRLYHPHQALPARFIPRWKSSETRIKITTGATTVADDVIHIELKDAQHGTMKTGAGDSRTTADAGQNWQKQ